MSKSRLLRIFPIAFALQFSSISQAGKSREMGGRQARGPVIVLRFENTISSEWVGMGPYFQCTKTVRKNRSSDDSTHTLKPFELIDTHIYAADLLKNLTVP